MIERFFRLRENHTTVRTELLAGVTTFLTMAYIIFVQPAVLSGRMFGFDTGMDFDSVTAATCVAAAVATLIMGIYARYPIAQAPGMGENFFFVFSVLPFAGATFAEAIRAGQTSPWEIGLGVVFVSGVLFLLLSVLGVREKLLDAISPSMRNGIAIGIGLFIAFIGLKNAGLIESDPSTSVKLNPNFASPDLIVFFYGLLVTASLHAMRVRGSIVWGIVASTVLAAVLATGLPYLLKDSSFEKRLTVRTAGGGLQMELASRWTTTPGSEPFRLALSPVVPPSEERSLTVHFQLAKGAQGQPDNEIVQSVAISPQGGKIESTFNARELAGAGFYRVVVMEDDHEVDGLSQTSWTPVPALPPLVAGSKLMTQFSLAKSVVQAPPSMLPTLWKMDLRRACTLAMIPFVLIFLFMDLFDTLGTLIGVSEQAGFIKNGRLPRAKEALVSDAVGTVVGAAMGTSTVTSFIESAAGVEQGGRTGLTAVTTAVLFLLALFFSPIIAMVGSYSPITAPALVVVGSMMMRNVTKIDWANYAESMPAFLIIIGIPLSYSIADGLALGFIAYPIIKVCARQGRDVRWLMVVMALVLVAYFLFVRMQVG